MWAYMQHEPYQNQYPLTLDLRKSYVLLIKRHDNFTAPLELAGDDAGRFAARFKRFYANYSSFTQPLRRWDQKTRRFLAEGARSALVLFSRAGIKREQQL